MAKPTIRARPHWALPSKDRIAQAKVLPKLLARFQNHLVGLRELRFIANEHTDDGIVRKGTVQRLEFSVAPNQKIPWTAEYLSRLAWLAAERYVRRARVKVQFRIYIVGSNQEQGNFSDEGVFTIRPDHTLDREPDEEDDDEDEGEEEDDEEADEDDEEDDAEGDDEDDEEILPPAMVPYESQQLVPSSERHPIPMHPNPQFIVSLQNNALRLAEGAYRGSMEANRVLVKEMRAEMSGMVQDIKGMAEQNNKAHLTMLQEIKSFFLEQNRNDRERVQALEKQLHEQSKLNVKQYENLQQLAQQGWKAFLDAMKMKSQVVDERIQWATWLEEERARSQPVAQESSGATSTIMKGAPVVLAGLSMIFRKRGDVESADLLADLSRRFAGPLEVDDEEEDEDEPVDVDAREASSHPPGPAPGPAPEPSAPTPFADRARAFRAKLGPERVEAMRSVLPKPAWRAFERACAARVDQVAISGLQTMYEFISQDVTLQLQLAEHLTEDQVAEILAIVDDVKKVAGPERRRRPRRPTPSADSPPPSE